MRHWSPAFWCRVPLMTSYWMCWLRCQFAGYDDDLYVVDATINVYTHVQVVILVIFARSRLCKEDVSTRPPTLPVLVDHAGPDLARGFSRGLGLPSSPVLPGGYLPTWPGVGGTYPPGWGVGRDRSCTYLTGSGVSVNPLPPWTTPMKHWSFL